LNAVIALEGKNKNQIPIVNEIKIVRTKAGKK
jgi:hypothetical protein